MLATPAIDHDILLWKLDTFYGIRGLPFKLLASYLQGRQQYSVVGDCRSSVLEISQGIPQGSSLRPLLFALYVNDLPKASTFNSTLFADDTVLSISSAKFVELQKLVNTELQKVDQWMRFNKFSLNYSKTSYMLIGPRGKRLHDFTVKLMKIPYPKQTPLNTWGCTLMINLLGQTTLPTLRKLFRAVLELSIELDTILTKEHLNPCILASSIVICNMQSELGVASVRQVFDGWTYCTTK